MLVIKIKGSGTEDFFCGKKGICKLGKGKLQGWKGKVGFSGGRLKVLRNLWNGIKDMENSIEKVFKDLLKRV